MIKSKKGQKIISGLLFFFMALVAVAVFMPGVRDIIPIGVNASENSTHGTLIVLIMTYWPVFLVIMMLIVLFVILRQ